MRLLPTLGLLALLTGCVAIPKDQDALPIRDVNTTALASDIPLAGEGWPQAQWWTQYGDAQLDRLVQQALAVSPGLQAAAARIEAAQAARSLSEAAAGGGLNLNAGTNRQRYSANGLFPAPIGGSTFNDFSVQVQARYDVDWWGKHRAQIAAAVGEANARRAEYAQAEQVLAASVVAAYFDLQSDWARAANLRKVAALQQSLLDDNAKRIAHGLAANDQLYLAEKQAGEQKRVLAQVDARALRDREALRALVGGESGDIHPAPLPDMAHALPAKLGFELLARRPDLQAARWRVEASMSRVDASEAAFYPDINLAGAFGLDALSLGQLLEAGSRTFLVGPTFNLPLFNEKTLKGQLGAARSARNEVVADYNQRILNVVRDVAQAGAALQGLEREIGHQGDAVAASEATLRVAQAKLRQGIADKASVLAAQLLVLQESDMHLQLQQQRAQAGVSLNMALGGGYRSADPITALTRK